MSRWSACASSAGTRPAADLRHASRKLGTARAVRPLLRRRQHGRCSAPPNIRPIADAIVALRAGCMGTLVPSGFDAPIRLARALERGGKAGCWSISMIRAASTSRSSAAPARRRRCWRNSHAISTARSMACAWSAWPDRNKFWVEITDPIDAGARRRGQDRHRRHHPGDRQCGRGLGARASRISGCGSTAAGGDPGRPPSPLDPTARS